MTRLDDDNVGDGGVVHVHNEENDSESTFAAEEPSTQQPSDEINTAKAKTMTTIDHEDTSSTSSSPLSSNIKSVPQEIWDPVLEHYVQYWFGRMNLHETVYDEMNGTDVTPLIEAVLKGDEVSVYLLLFIRDLRELAAKANVAASSSQSQQLLNEGSSEAAADRDVNHDDGEFHHNTEHDILRDSDSHGWKAIHYAVLKRNEAIVRLLLDYDREKHERKKKKYSAEAGQVNNNSSNNYDWLINIPKTDSETPLHIATDCGNQSMVQLLLSQEYADIIDVNRGDILLNTPLHVAVKRRQYNIAKLLLEVGNANPNTKSLFRNKTPLHFTIFHDNDLIRLLIDHGCDVTSQDSDGNTWLHLMLKNHPKWYTQDDYDTIAYVLETDRKNMNKKDNDDGLSVVQLCNKVDKSPLDMIGKCLPSPTQMVRKVGKLLQSYRMDAS